jgi:hypothetical protein
MYSERISTEEADDFFDMEDANLPEEIKLLSTLDLDITNEYNVGSYVLQGPFQSTNNSNLIFTVTGKKKGEDGWQMVKFFKKHGTDITAPYFIVSDTIKTNNGLESEEWRVWNDTAELLRGIVIDSLNEDDKISIWNETLEINNSNNNNNNNRNRNNNEDPSLPENNRNNATNNPSGGKRKIRKNRLRKTKRKCKRNLKSRFKSSKRKTN